MRVIAEAGSLTKGDPIRATDMIDAAKSGGADCIKFILSNPDELIAQDVDYMGKSLHATIKSYQMSDDDWRFVTGYAEGKHLAWYASIGTADYIPLLEELGCPTYKIGGWDSRNHYLFDAIKETGKKVEVDIGAIIEPEVNQIIDYFGGNIHLVYESHGTPSEYNLNAIAKLQAMNKYTDRTVGYSSEGKESTSDLLAVGLGITSIEKRIKPDDKKGHHTDKALNPKEFKEWVKTIREAEAMMGVKELRPSMADVAGKQLYFTSLVFDRDAKQGEVITRDMLACRRPGSGLSPYYDFLFIGKTLARDVTRNEILTYDNVTGVV